MHFRYKFTKVSPRQSFPLYGSNHTGLEFLALKYQPKTSLIFSSVWVMHSLAQKCFQINTKPNHQDNIKFKTSYSNNRITYDAFGLV